MVHGIGLDSGRAWREEGSIITLAVVIRNDGTYIPLYVPMLEAQNLRETAKEN